MGLFSLLGNLGAGIQGARLGKKQMQLGEEMMTEAEKLSAAYERPEMKTPEAINMMMGIASGRRFENMPGITMAQNQIGETAAGALNAVKEMGIGAEGLGAVSDIYSKSLDASGNIAIQNALFKDKAETDYMGALEGLGNWEQKAWQWNKADPYMNAQNKAAMLEMMGRSGQWEGLKTKMGSWAKTFQGAGGELDSMSEQIFSALSGGMAGGAGGASSLLSGGMAGLIG